MRVKTDSCLKEQFGKVRNDNFCNFKEVGDYKNMAISGNMWLVLSLSRLYHERYIEKKYKTLVSTPSFILMAI